MMETANAQHSLASETNRRNGIWKLTFAMATIACLWCMVLPWYASQPSMKEHLEFLDDRGIDPSAMFYTELDAMDVILEKIE
jgi:hypothetical protein